MLDGWTMVELRLDLDRSSAMAEMVQWWESQASHGAMGPRERCKAWVLDDHGQGKFAKSIVETNLRGNGHNHHFGKMVFYSGPRERVPDECADYLQMERRRCGKFKLGWNQSSSPRRVEGATSGDAMADDCCCSFPSTFQMSKLLHPDSEDGWE